MNVLIYLVPMALALGLTGLIAFLWSLRAGQYDDLDGAALRVLSDEDVSGARPEYGARRMTRRIAIIQGHPDPAGHHLLHAMADAYAEGATAAGHEVRRIEVALLDFPLLRTQVDFESGALPPALSQPREDMHWAEHWVFLFPLWHGTLPALFKGFLEHIFRPGFAVEYKKDRFPKPLLAGRSARIVVTMGMPALIYRWYFGAAGLRGFERSMLGFSGIKPIRESLYGLTFADDRKRARWIEDMRRHGVRGD